MGAMSGAMTTPASVRVVTCDDHPIIGLMLAQLLRTAEGEPVLEVAGSYRTAESLLARWSDDRPDVVVLDLTLGGDNGHQEGLELLERIVARAPDTPTLVYSAVNDPAVVRRALEQGADGFVTKTAPPSTLVQAVRDVAAGARPVLDPATATQLAVAVMAQGDRAELSGREREVMELVAAGLTNRQIGSRLGISENSVKSLLKRAVVKLESPDRASAVAEAFRRGILR